MSERFEQDELMDKIREELDFTVEFTRIGRSWVELDENDQVIRVDPKNG